MRIKLTKETLIPAGILITLTAKQAKARTHILGSDKAGEYKLEKQIGFKAGEVIGFHVAPKGLGREIDELIRDRAKEITIEDIVTAIIAVDGDDSSLWASDEKPTIAALEFLLESEITEKQREDAWSLYMKDPPSE